MPGRLTSWKGQELFIKSIHLVKTELGYEAFHVVILGSEQGRDLYKNKLVNLTEQYNLSNQIKFIDHCEDMALAYKVSDIVVSASIEPEAFGRVAVEAQAMQKPIIATKLGGSMETGLNNKTGILYKFDDPRELAKNINSFMETDKLALNIMGVEGRKNVMKKFDVEKMCQSTFNEYKKLLNL